MKKILMSVLLTALTIGTAYAEKSYNVGILAKRGIDGFYERWLPLAAYLRDETGNEHNMVPLKFDEIDTAVRTGKVDFILTNPSMFVTLQEKYAIRPIATMINQSMLGSHTDTFGGVIITSKASKGVKNLTSIRGRTFYAVKKSSLGGYQMALKEFKDQGIDLTSQAKKIEFLGTHDKVVQAVLAKPGTLGTVRTNILERMAYAGKINMDDIRIVGEKSHKGFPYKTSTVLYPEWPMGQLRSTPHKAANDMARALRKLDEQNFASTSARIAGWSEPGNYNSVKTLLQEIGML